MSSRPACTGLPSKFKASVGSFEKQVSNLRRQTELSEFQDSQGYTVKPCLKQKQKQTNKKEKRKEEKEDSQRV